MIKKSQRIKKQKEVIYSATVDMILGIPKPWQCSKCNSIYPRYVDDCSKCKPINNNNDKQS